MLLVSVTLHLSDDPLTNREIVRGQGFQYALPLGYRQLHGDRLPDRHVKRELCLKGQGPQ